MSLSYANIQDRVEQLLCFQSCLQFLNLKRLFNNLLLRPSQLLFKATIGNMINSVRQQLKILQAIIVFNPILVMDYFPGQKTSTKMFCHYKTMFSNIASPIRHRIEKIILPYPNNLVSVAVNIATFISRIICSPETMTMLASKAYRFTMFHKNPSRYATDNTSMPNYSFGGFSIVAYCSTIFNYFSNLWHSFIIS